MNTPVSPPKPPVVAWLKLEISFIALIKEKTPSSFSSSAKITLF